MAPYHRILPLCLAAGLAWGCGDDADDPRPAATPPTAAAPEVRNAPFPTEDDAKRLDGTPAHMLRTLLDDAGPGIVKDLRRIEITEDEYEEIGDFASGVVAGLTTQADKYAAIFKWITSNIRYDFGDNRPYAVFKNRYGVCEGYASLLTVMCCSQGIPAMMVSGGLYNEVLGHAFVYLYADGEWIVSDPTNGGSYEMADESSYGILIPLTACADIFEDEQFAYSFTDKHLNVREVRTGGEQLTVPYSAGGYVLTSFCPDTALPGGIREIYLGKNIETLGENGVGLERYGPNVEAAYVDEGNPVLRSHAGVVYKRNDGAPVPCYIPAAMTRIEFLPMATVGKNVLYDNRNVTEVVFPAGTGRIEAYAIEKCPNLRTIYIPADAVVEENAFDGVAPDVQVIRGDPSGIRPVTL